MKHQLTNYYTQFDLEIFEGTLSSHVYPWHYHDCYTIILILKGSMKYVFREQEIVVQQGDVFVVNPFISHYNLPVIECEYKVIFLPVSYVSDHPDNFCIIQFQKEAGNNNNLFNALLQAFEHLKVLSTKNACEEIEKGIAQLLLNYFQTQTKTLVIDKRIIPAIEFIKSNLDKKLTIAEIAKTCHASRFHFQRLFKKNTGLTVKEYIHQLRTEFAKNLLRTSNKVTNISFETGYFDQSHFIKSFKKMWSVTPHKFASK